MTANILLIYNLVPDEVLYFSIPSDFEDIDIIKGAHGAMINVNDPSPVQQAGVDYINDASSTNTEYCNNIDNVGKLLPYQVEEKDLIDMSFVGVVVASFYL